MIFSLICSEILEKLLNGVDPILVSKYKTAMNLSNNTFRCFDNSRVITLDKFNDNYQDC